MLKKRDDSIDGKLLVFQKKFDEFPRLPTVICIKNGFQPWDAFQRHTVANRTGLLAQGVQVMVNVDLHFPVAECPLVDCNHIISCIHTDFIVVFLDDDPLSNQIFRH